MKLLVNFLFFLFLSQQATALIPWLHHRSHEEQNRAEIEDRSLTCKLDTVLLACKALGAQATTFCSSYLHISTTTLVVSSTTPTTTTASTTSTIVTTTTTTTTATDVSTSTSTTTTTTSAPYVFTGYYKRKVTAKPAPAPIPPILSKFLAAEISSACSCLSIKPHTTTTTTLVPSLVTSTYTSLTTSTSTSTTVYTTSTTTTALATATSVIPGVCTPGGQPCDFAHPEDCCSLGCTSGFTGSNNPVCCYGTPDGLNCG